MTFMLRWLTPVLALGAATGCTTSFDAPAVDAAAAADAGGSGMADGGSTGSDGGHVEAPDVGMVVGIDGGMVVVPGPDASGPIIDCPAEGGTNPPCCYRTSNAASLESPSLRVVGFTVGTPMALASPLVSGIVQDAIDHERFQLLMHLGEVRDGNSTTVRIGAGTRNADGTYGFLGAALEPQVLDGSITGETWRAGPATGTVLIPAFGAGGELLTEFPLQGLTIDTATFTTDRSCVGDRRGRGWGFGEPPSSLTAYITVEDAMGVELAPPATDLCSFIAGASCTNPQATWPTEPNDRCDGGTCGGAECDPAGTCNAFRVEASFAAAGVTIR